MYIQFYINTKKINEIMKNVILDSNNFNIARFDKTNGDNVCTEGFNECATRNQKIRELSEKSDFIKITKDNKNTNFKYNMYNVPIKVLNKKESIRILKQIKNNNKYMNYNLLPYFQNDQINEIYYSIKKDLDNIIIEIFVVYINTEKKYISKPLSIYKIDNNIKEEQVEENNIIEKKVVGENIEEEPIGVSLKK
ncbi:MAG: hypothetical protein Ta2D_12410 [Rickettsiales bacterium]|nr:MAG: hypothetical protein Ta2D_12410 [Rickettsiales bacterium]